MGAWSTSITGNDTAKDLYSEYTAVFYKYDVNEALELIDHYIRTKMFDESDKEEWCNYFYSLADFMWRKGILTEAVKQKAIEMIDSGFGLEIWAESGQKILNTRKKKLQEFKEKLLSPQPPKKKIKPNVQTERIFHDGDIIAVQLQTAGKPYTKAEERPMSEQEFHALDGKYVLMQLIDCYASWTSDIVPEVKDYWACFRLFDGIFDCVPEDIDVDNLKEAMIHQGQHISSQFTCESNMYYFKRRKYKVICNRQDLIADLEIIGHNYIFWSINKPWRNPDSQLVSAMGLEIKCYEYNGTFDTVAKICKLANRYGAFNYNFTKEENEAKYTAKENLIIERINTALANGGKIYSISFGKEIGIITIENGRIDNLYIDGQYQRNGFGTKLLKYAFFISKEKAFIDVPKDNTDLLHICKKIGLSKSEENEDIVRMENKNPP